MEWARNGGQNCTSNACTNNKLFEKLLNQSPFSYAYANARMLIVQPNATSRHFSHAYFCSNARAPIQIILSANKCATNLSDSELEHTEPTHFEGKKIHRLSWARLFRPLQSRFYLNGHFAYARKLVSSLFYCTPFRVPCKMIWLHSVNICMQLIAGDRNSWHYFLTTPPPLNPSQTKRLSQYIVRAKRILNYLLMTLVSDVD